jgi:hypothetical protein
MDDSTPTGSVIIVPTAASHRPWTVQRLPGGSKLVDASSERSLAYFYARDNDNDAGIAGVLTIDEARRLARATSPSCQQLLGKGD